MDKKCKVCHSWWNDTDDYCCTVCGPDKCNDCGEETPDLFLHKDGMWRCAECSHTCQKCRVMTDTIIWVDGLGYCSSCYDEYIKNK